MNNFLDEISNEILNNNSYKFKRNKFTKINMLRIC